MPFLIVTGSLTECICFADSAMLDYIIMLFKFFHAASRIYRDILYNIARVTDVPITITLLLCLATKVNNRLGEEHACMGDHA